MEVRVAGGCQAGEELAGAEGRQWTSGKGGGRGGRKELRMHGTGRRIRTAAAAGARKVKTRLSEPALTDVRGTAAGYGDRSKRHGCGELPGSLRFRWAMWRWRPSVAGWLSTAPGHTWQEDHWTPCLDARTQ